MYTVGVLTTTTHSRDNQERNRQEVRWGLSALACFGLSTYWARTGQNAERDRKERCTRTEQTEERGKGKSQQVGSSNGEKQAKEGKSEAYAVQQHMCKTVINHSRICTLYVALTRKLWDKEGGAVGSGQCGKER